MPRPAVVQKYKDKNVQNLHENKNNESMKIQKITYAERGWRRKYGKICVVFFLLESQKKKQSKKEEGKICS